MGCSELSAPNKVTCPFIFICFILYPSKIPSLLLGLHPLFSASSLHLSPTISISTIPSPFAVCPSDCGDVLWRGGGDRFRIHRYLPGAGKQRHGVQPAGASQQGHGHQHCRGGVQETQSYFIFKDVLE